MPDVLVKVVGLKTALIVIGVIGVVLIGMGLFTFGGIDSTFFEPITGFSLIDINSPRLVCTDTTCVWNWRSLDPFTIGSIGGLKEKIDLSLINVNEPIIVDWKIDLIKISDDCERLLTDPLLGGLRLNIEVNDGEDFRFPTIAGETQRTDISDVVTETTGELELRFGSQACQPLDAQKLELIVSDGKGSAPTITFTRAGEQRSMDEMMQEMLNMTSPVKVECFGCAQTVIAIAEDESMCPVLDCAGFTPPPPRPTLETCDPPLVLLNGVCVIINGVEPENGNGIMLPDFMITAGVATIVFVVVGLIMIAVVGTAIYLRRRDTIAF